MSTPTVSFGFTLPQRGILFGVTTVPALMASATEADSSGLFDSIWVGDSLFAKPRPNSLALLGALTALTKKVMTVPGRFFDVNPGGGRPPMKELKKWVRFSFGPPEAKVRMGLERLEEMIKGD